MSLPPSSYPKLRGQPCGADWSKPTVVNGHLPGTGWGSQFKHTIEPVLPSRTPLINLGSARDEQIVLRDKIVDAIANRRAQLGAFTPSYMVLDAEEKDSIEWLLDHAEAELDAADDLWDKWDDRAGGRWPLNLSDSLSTYGGGVCTQNDMGSWKRVSDGHRAYNTLCPSWVEIEQRSKDRRAIEKHFDHALAHLYCADYGYWRLSLYKEAYHAYKEQPGSGIGGKLTPGQGGPVVTPGLQIPGMGLAGKTLDPCRDFGMDCPPGEPKPPECPSGFCIDPEALPDPGVVQPPEGGPLVPEPEPTAPGMKRVKAPYYIVGGLGALVLTGVAYQAYR